MIKILDKTFEIYIEETKILQRVAELGKELDRDFKDKNPLMISVLNGAFIFSADLIRCMGIQPEITFIRVASYEELQSTGKVKEVLGLKENIFNRDILLVEDIVDTGETLSYLVEMFETLGPKSISIVTLLHKPEAQQKSKKPDYIGFEIPPKFVLGYGLDYNGLGRELRDLYQLV
ncbi:hypoxanthine phosphoribosyltransferase [Marivirga sp. S37H4]|uniref:Hypoxanthine phosphoribosyltransferase n=1 Tax=Marivirga aurantiaca TaxID=2802615 RepID=A0A934WYP5_9BACT|nr:hypoxanthine phosphoribosyltransferase [Marivirga aurantiaca]MBK6265444.1 hypoxanthine phosphoribosyltransferase [Marivirga aurantiaca]